MANKIRDAMRETMEGLNRVIPVDPTIMRRFDVTAPDPSLPTMTTHDTSSKPAKKTRTRARKL